MKGYVLQGKGDAAWQEVPVPQIGPYDALVRPTAALPPPAGEGSGAVLGRESGACRPRTGPSR
jgi:hypothetical protein